MNPRMPDKRRMITVCDECLRASCWQALIMCYRSGRAGTVRLPERTLESLGREHRDYWLTDDEVANGVKPGRQHSTATTQGAA